MDLLTLGKQPVKQDQPTGADARYDPAFEELQAEVDKPPSASGGVDWTKVGKLSSEILEKKSKDLLVASYLAVSLLYTKKIEGFATGLKVYRDLVETYWETLFPTKARMRGRVGAIEWWAEKAEIALSGVEPVALPPEKMGPIREDFDRIDQLLGEYLDEPPSLRPLLEYVRALESASEEAAKPEEAPSESSAEAEREAEKKEAAPAPAVPRGDVLPEIESAEAATEAFSLIVRKLREIAAYRRKENLADPLAYRVLRWAVWTKIDSLPQAREGRTTVPPPMPQVSGPLADMQSRANSEGLARAAESALSTSAYWLDLNRYSAEALSVLGDQYQRALDAGCQETAYFVHRFHGVEDLAFSDGKPFADADTRQWLKTIALGTGSGAGPAAVAEPGADGTDLQAELGKALQLAGKGKLSEAVEPLHQRMRSAVSRREEMLWRMAVVQVLIGGRQPGVAVPQAERIVADIDAFRLEEYDPEVALRGLRLALSVYEAQPDPASRASAAAVLGRMANLNPMEALRLTKARK